MDTDFKVPTTEPKIKFIPKKVKQSENADNSDEKKKKIDKIKAGEKIKAGDKIDESDKPGTSKQTTKPKKIKTALKCPYIEPKWSKKPDAELNYNLEVLKNGTIVETIKDLQTKAYWTIGKLPDNDIVMANPTISRYHAVLQYRPNIVPDKESNDDSNSDEEPENDTTADNKQKNKIEMGWYLYDLDSTQRCRVNKRKIPIKTYVRVRVGYMLQFGASARKYILQGPNFDAEAESELTITEMKELKLKQEQERQEQLILEEQKKEAEGVSWGMSEDADEETDLSHNPYAATNNEELFLQDPKKTLRGFFEREGFDLEYKADEMSAGTFICRIELPVTDSNGRNITAEVCHKGKKKDCVHQCALEACRILDRHGVLRQANHEPQKRKRAKSSDDDDDDEFYDRTTEAEEKRRRKAGNEQSAALSYDELLEQEKQLQQKLNDAEQKIQKHQELDKLAKQKSENENEDLDDFMSNLSGEKQLDKTEIRKLRFEIQRLRNDLSKVKRLINITRPVDLPPLQLPENVDENKLGEMKKKPALPLFGKKGTFGLGRSTANLSTKLPQATTTTKTVSKSTEATTSSQDFAEEFDEDDETEMKAKRLTEELNNKPTTSSSEAINTQSPLVAEVESLKQPQCSTAAVSGVERKAISQKPTKRVFLVVVVDDDEVSSSTSQSVEPEKPDELTNTAVDSSTSEASKGENKKKRNRTRARDDKPRDNIDIDDAEEAMDTEKYAGWIPPENQSGDGVTDLNSKYGY